MVRANLSLLFLAVGLCPARAYFVTALAELTFSTEPTSISYALVEYPGPGASLTHAYDIHPSTYNSAWTTHAFSLGVTGANGMNSGASGAYSARLLIANDSPDPLHGWLLYNLLLTAACGAGGNSATAAARYDLTSAGTAFVLDEHHLTESWFPGGTGYDERHRNEWFEYYVGPHGVGVFDLYLAVSGNASVPEPATIIGLGIGALAFVRRRNRPA